MNKLPFLLILVFCAGCMDSSNASDPTSRVPATAAAAQSGSPREALLSAVDVGNVELVEKLITTQKLSPDLKDASGNTLLMLATKKRRNLTVKALLRLGADPKLKNAQGESALSIAEQEENGEAVKLLKPRRHSTAE